MVNVHRVIIPVDRPKSSASRAEEHQKKSKSKSFFRSTTLFIVFFATVIKKSFRIYFLTQFRLVGKMEQQDSQKDCDDISSDVYNIGRHIDR